jgi:hypothetical protein
MVQTFFFTSYRPPKPLPDLSLVSSGAAYCTEDIMMVHKSSDVAKSPGIYFPLHAVNMLVGHIVLSHLVKLLQ